MSLIPKKGTVYVVDDDEAVRDSLQWLLEGKDYRVRCFDSAESFISRYDPREVACLIADIRMGGMTGLELQDRLIERKSPLPIVFITGHGDVPMAVNTMKKGAMDFIQKPFKEEELLGLVERMLDEAREAFAGHQQAASRDALHHGNKHLTLLGDGQGLRIARVGLQEAQEVINALARVVVRAERVADVVCRELSKAFGAVAALQQERLAFSRQRQLLF